MEIENKSKIAWKTIGLFLLITLLFCGTIYSLVVMQQIKIDEKDQIIAQLRSEVSQLKKEDSYKEDDDTRAELLQYISTDLKISFSYSVNLKLEDLLNSDEKSILLGDKIYEMPANGIASGKYAAIRIQRTNSERNDALSKAITSVKKFNIKIDGLDAIIEEGKYPGYPTDEALHLNNMKLITIPDKDITITLQDAYAGQRSDYEDLEKELAIIIESIKFL
jgi:hypothetical protein